MSNELVNVDLSQLPSTQVGNDADFEAMSQGSDFPGRVQLFSKGAPIDTGLIPPGTYGIPENDKKIIKLGNEINILPLARRLKALDMSDKSAIIANYDPNSDSFKDIQARSVESESGCMYGTSFLVFERTTGRFLEFFCGSKSTRPVAADIAPFMALSQAQIDAKKAAGADVSQMKPHGVMPCTLKVRLAKNKRGHTWHVPEVQACSVPFTNVPAAKALLDETNKFLSVRNGEV